MLAFEKRVIGLAALIVLGLMGACSNDKQQPKKKGAAVTQPGTPEGAPSNNSGNSTPEGTTPTQGGKSGSDNNDEEDDKPSSGKSGKAGKSGKEDTEEEEEGESTKPDANAGGLGGLLNPQLLQSLDPNLVQALLKQGGGAGGLAGVDPAKLQDLLKGLPNGGANMDPAQIQALLGQLKPKP